MTEKPRDANPDAGRWEPNPGVAAHGNDQEAFTNAVLERAYDAGRRTLQGDKAADLLLRIRPKRSLVTRYLRHVQQTMGYHALWPPNTHLSVGDIAVLRDEVLIPVSSLGELGVDVSSTTEPMDTHMSIAYGQTRVELDPLDASREQATPSSANHVLRIAFDDFGAFLAVFRGNTRSELQGPDASRLLDLERQGKWQGDWVLITSTVETTAGVVLMAAADDARVEFAVPSEALSATGGGFADLLLRLDVGLAASANMSSVMRWNQSATPLAKGHRVKRGFLSGHSSLIPTI
jgi:hypothetical protein